MRTLTSVAGKVPSPSGIRRKEVATSSAREGAGAELLQAAEAAEVEQQSILDAAPVEQAYQESLSLYVRSKHDQVERLEDRLEHLINRQQASLQQTLSSGPGRLSLPGSKRAWQNQQTQQQARLQILHTRLEAVREIKEGMGLHSPRIEELAARKMRTDNPDLASEWDKLREAARRDEVLVRTQHQRRHVQDGERPSRARTLGLTKL